jgi:hypothetical protein
MQKIIFSVLMLFIFSSFTAFAQQTKISLQKGQKYQVETTTKLTNTVEAMGQSMENNMDSKSTTLYEIMNAGADSFDLKSTITKMVVTGNMMGQETNFDSDKKDNEGPMTEMFSKSVNKPRGIVLNAKGAVTKNDGGDAGGPMGVMVSNLFATELFIPALIGKELKTGDSFTDTSSSNKDKYSSRDSGTYTVKEVENGVANISYSGTQVINAVMEQMGMEMTYLIKNKIATEMQVDIKTGMVLIKATVYDSEATFGSGGITFPSTGKVITTVKITPANDQPMR